MSNGMRRELALGTCGDISSVRAVCLDLHFMEKWEVRCESWTGPHDVSAKELGRVPRGGGRSLAKRFP